MDAANWAVDRGNADPNALAIMGSSYGGNAAAMALVRDPALFTAAIIENAMLDVAYQSQYPPHSWGLHLALWKRYFGNSENPDDLKQMQQRSPMAKIDNLLAATLMVAGKRDSIAGFEQTEKIKQTKAANKNIASIIFENEGHGIDKWQFRMHHARRVEDFLAKYLGGAAATSTGCNLLPPIWRNDRQPNPERSYRRRSRRALIGWKATPTWASQ